MGPAVSNKRSPKSTQKASAGGEALTITEESPLRELSVFHRKDSTGSQ